jgi:trehalose-phosphatase
MYGDESSCILMTFLRFLLDYDGTLAAFNKTPQAFSSPHRIHSILKKINQDPNNVIYVTSGRSKENLDEQLGKIPNIGLRCVSIEL